MTAYRMCQDNLYLNILLKRHVQVSWDLTQCSPVHVYRRFTKSCCFHHEAVMWSEMLVHFYRIASVRFKNISVLIATARITSNVTPYFHSQNSRSTDAAAGSLCEFSYSSTLSQINGISVAIVPPC
jgi:hypothetical protein